MLAAVAATVVACSSSTVKGTSGAQIADISASALPPTINGLSVAREDIRSTIAKGSDTYVAAAGLFSMRAQDVVEATLEIAELTSAARTDSPTFQLALASQVGGSTPDTARVADVTVYFTNATKQRVYVWFRPHTLYVLSVRDDYTAPRGLLRDSIAMRS
jgi:hypothetical protein